MLILKVSTVDGFDEMTSEFVSAEDHFVKLEHSLVSLSKWEAKWEKPFLGSGDKTDEQILDYVRMMIIGESPDQAVFSRLSDTNFKDVNAYIEAKMSATWFNEVDKQQSTEIVTAELIYYWMITLGIPFECQEWHLNRLLTLIKVCSMKNAPEQKMSATEIAARNRNLNAQRRAEIKSKG